MSTQKLYDLWSATYDDVENKTRDLEKIACRKVLSDISFANALELGGGTGKNTLWLADRAQRVISLDLSSEMQAVAKEKIYNTNVEFRMGDIRKPWGFIDSMVDLITCSLILEHIDDLEFIFQQANNVLADGGHFYVCELHPFKQYVGGKARFDFDGEQLELDSFQHHVTDYTLAAVKAGFTIAEVDEWFDDENRNQMPRLISFLFRK